MNLRKIAKEIISDVKEITQKDLNDASRKFFGDKYDINLNLNELLNEKYVKIKEESFDGRDCGVMEAMIANGKVEISAGISKEQYKIYIKIEFSYKHRDHGTNGHSDRYIYDIAKRTWGRD